MDEIHNDNPEVLYGDSNSYVFGNIGLHNVVIVCLPSGTYGITPAARVAVRMRMSFPYMRIRLMVGIGGGAPCHKLNKTFDIRLGDVVVSDPSHTSSGVIQYDFGHGSSTMDGEKRCPQQAA